MRRPLLALGLALALGVAALPSRAVINALDAVPAATLLLPHFEVDVSGSAYPGPVTIVRLANVSPNPVLAHLTLWTDLGVPTRAFDLYIGGNDVVEIDLRLLLNGVIPQAARLPWLELVGSGSTGPTPFPGCPAAPLPGNGRLSADEVAGLKAAHTGKASSLVGGRCAGEPWGDQVARGYATIDTVGRCSSSTTFPGSAGYFATDASRIATDQNVLFGESSLVDRASGSDVADLLVPIEASASDPRTSTPGTYTFYGRLAGVNGTATDHREALFNNWQLRFSNGGLFDRGTRAVVWRDPGPSGPFPCPALPAGLGHAGVVVFDESEQIGALPALPLFPLASEAIALHDPARFPLPFSFGFLTANLDRNQSLAPFGVKNQAYVGIELRSSGGFAAALPAAPMQHVSETLIVFPSDGILYSQCNDGIDNDGDGAVDFPEDTGCASSFSTAEKPRCQNGIDDDSDGWIDFPADSSCSSPFDDDEMNPPSFPCRNGKDDDGDGLVDFPADPGCEHQYDPSESIAPECSDGIDNDGAEGADYPADPGCLSPNDTWEGNVPECSDGWDNNGADGADYPNDPGCASARDRSESSTNECNDGVDNDSDGKADYPVDPGCGSQWSGDESPECSDGANNDTDAWTDFPSDPGCSGASDTSEEPNPQCGDGVNNNPSFDSATDYPADPDCTSLSDNTESPPQCRDGVDNDGDGSVDYGSDMGCSSLDDTSEASEAECLDGKDNDGNGFADYPNDPNCASSLDWREWPACSDGLNDDVDYSWPPTLDYPADPDCASAADMTEDEGTTTVPECADGIDNDGDLLIDYPADPGCISRYDRRETNPVK